MADCRTCRESNTGSAVRPWFTETVMLVGRNLWRLIVQPCAQSRNIVNTRSDYVKQQLMHSNEPILFYT